MPCKSHPAFLFVGELKQSRGEYGIYLRKTNHQRKYVDISLVDNITPRCDGGYFRGKDPGELEGWLYQYATPKNGWRIMKIDPETIPDKVEE